jgi:translocation and assembly module TamB
MADDTVPPRPPEGPDAGPAAALRRHPAGIRPASSGAGRGGSARGLPCWRWRCWAPARTDLPIGHRFVADRIATLAPASGLRITVGRIDGSLFGKAGLKDLVLSDPNGPFLTVPDVDLDWRPYAWTVNTLDIRTLALHRGTLLRRPQLKPGDPNAPILPSFNIRVDRLEIDALTIAPGVMGERRRVDLTARADVRSGHPDRRQRPAGRQGPAGAAP